MLREGVGGRPSHAEDEFLYPRHGNAERAAAIRTQWALLDGGDLRYMMGTRRPECNATAAQSRDSGLRLPTVDGGELAVAHEHQGHTPLAHVCRRDQGHGLPRATASSQRREQGPKVLLLAHIDGVGAWDRASRRERREEELVDTSSMTRGLKVGQDHPNSIGHVGLAGALRSGISDGRDE